MQSKNKETIYGIQPVMEALAQAVPLNKVFIQKDMHNERIQDIIRQLRQRMVPFQFVPKEKLNRLTMKNHQGIVAVTSVVEFESIEDVLPQIFEEGTTPLIAILDNVTDVRNFGAISRSAECFGIQAMVVPAQGSAMANAEAMKASAGALHKVKVCREINFRKSVQLILDSGLQLVACTEKTDKSITDIDFSLPTAIVMGSEGEGIHPELLALCSERAAIPMVGEIQSLNVSVAAGVIFYEAMMQRLKE